MISTHAQTRPARRAAWVRRDAGLPDSTASAKATPLSPPGVGGEACLSSEVERLLGDVAADGFALYCCGPRAAPCALVASYQWEDYLDLLTIRRFDRITTARIPAPQRARMCSPRRPWFGPMKGHHSQRCGHYSTCYPQPIPTPPPVLTPRHPPCTFPALSNAP
jgi:hypothetical protein